MSLASVYGGFSRESVGGTELEVSLDKYQQAFVEQSKIEANNLESMLFQVEMGKHLLKSLMKHLNNGGFQDEKIWRRINDAQHSLMKLNEAMVKFTRSLPSFFSQFAEDMNRYGLETTLASPQENFDEYEDIDDEELLALDIGDDENEEYTLTDKPVRGQGNLLKMLDAIMEQDVSLQADINEVENIDVTRDGNAGNNPLRDEEGKRSDDIL